MTFILKLGAARGALQAKSEQPLVKMRPSTAGECAAARAGRASRSNAPLPAARAPWLFLAGAAPVRRRAPRSSALQQPPHSR